jgi:metal-dependent HD superfamily phosphatase/phosphodiesterase
MNTKKPAMGNVKKILIKGAAKATKFVAENHPNTILAQQSYRTSKKVYDTIMKKQVQQAHQEIRNVSKVNRLDAADQRSKNTLNLSNK